MFEIFGLFHLAALLRRADYMRDRKILGGHIYRKQARRVVIHSELTELKYIVRLTTPLFEICLNKSFTFRLRYEIK